MKHSRSIRTITSAECIFTIELSWFLLKVYCLKSLGTIIHTLTNAGFVSNQCIPTNQPFYMSSIKADMYSISVGY